MFTATINTISNFLTSLNWVDILIIIILAVYFFEGWRRGALKSLFDLLTFVISFFLGLKLYSPVATVINHFIQIPHGISLVIGFFIAVFIIEAICQAIFRLFINTRIAPLSLPAFLNGTLGGIGGLISGIIFIMFLLSSIIALPQLLRSKKPLPPQP